LLGERVAELHHLELARVNCDDRAEEQVLHGEGRDGGLLEERAAVLEVEHLDVARGGPIQELVPTGQPAVRVEPLHDERELLGRVSLRNEGGARAR
jgi:hypothetical protein